MKNLNNESQHPRINEPLKTSNSPKAQKYNLPPARPKSVTDEAIKASQAAWNGQHKTCTACSVSHPATLEFFPYQRGGKYGYESRCHPCYVASLRARRERDKKDGINRDKRQKRPKEQHGNVIRWLVDGKEPTHKLCGGPCKLTKPVIEFNTRGQKINGKPIYRSKCKACESLYHKNPERIQVRREQQKIRSRAKVEAKRALLPQPKEGYRFCAKCKNEKLLTIEFFEKCLTNKGRLKWTCRVCSTKEKQKHTKTHLSHKHNHRFCYHCDQEFVLNEFKTETGQFGFVCKRCRIDSYKTNKEKTLDEARRRLRNFLFSTIEKYSEEIGCTNFELRLYLQKQFIFDMSWDNYGTYWHLDHYYPLSRAFEYSLEAYAKARHFTNIKPIRALDNMIKHDGVPWEFRDINDFLKDWIPPQSKEVEIKKAFSWD